MCRSACQSNDRQEALPQSCNLVMVWHKHSPFQLPKKLGKWEAFSLFWCLGLLPPSLCLAPLCLRQPMRTCEHLTFWINRIILRSVLVPVLKIQKKSLEINIHLRPRPQHFQPFSKVLMQSWAVTQALVTGWEAPTASWALTVLVEIPLGLTHTQSLPHSWSQLPANTHQGTLVGDPDGIPGFALAQLSFLWAFGKVD